MTVVNAAVDHGYANPCSVVAGVPGGAYTRSYIRDVIQSLHGMVDAHGENLRVGFQRRKCAYRNRESDALDHAEPVVQPRAQSLHSSFLRRLRNLLVLHDDLHSLIRGRSLMGSSGNGSEVRRRTCQPACRRLPSFGRRRPPQPGAPTACSSVFPKLRYDAGLGPGSLVSVSAT